MTLVPKLAVLPSAQQALWPSLEATRALGFVLYGGTGLALRLGHRSSEDFDFFTDRPLDREAMREAFPFLVSSERIQDEANTVTVFVTAGEERLKVSFFGSLHMGRVGVPDVTDDGILEIASPDDLLAHKLKVIFERAEVKDYRDIAAIIGSGLSLESGLGAARALFGKEFEPAIALRALTYFDEPTLSSLACDERVVLSRASAAVRAVPELQVISKRLSI